MDSLTQIVLGAAVAEASLGKKIGNRAMVWGAIGGTIPDLDVIANGFMSPIDALAFHRGPTHSALYLTLLAILIGWSVSRMYLLPYHKWIGIAAWGLLSGSIGLSIIFIGSFTLIKFIIGLAFILLSALIIYKRYFRKNYERPDANTKDWIWLFILVLVTHPILDCFTTYGTQILLPFSSERVAFNNISVADPLYTFPFLICLIILMNFSRNNPKRVMWNKIGLYISCGYMIFTIYNKTRINSIFENSLNQSDIRYQRYMTTPSILNNILWSGIAETDSAYYYGSYSFFDQNKSFILHRLDKNREDFKTELQNDSTLKTLRWFSDDYFLLKYRTPDSLEYFDLRFGTFRIKPNDPDQFVFKFNMAKKKDGSFFLLDQGDSPRDANIPDVFAALWKRMMGNTL